MVEEIPADQNEEGNVKGIEENPGWGYLLCKCCVPQDDEKDCDTFDNVPIHVSVIPK